MFLCKKDFMNKINKRKRILVCGGTGFIGQRLVKTLEKQGRRVNLLEGDIQRKKDIESALKKSDIAINLVGSFDKDIFLLNALSNVNFLKACGKFNIEKVIFTSSQSVYGEYSGKLFIESARPEPLTEYGLSKYLGEEIYRFYSNRYNIPSIILRLSNVYGPGQKKGVVLNFFNNILRGKPVKIKGDGKQKRDFLYIDDAVNSIIRSIDYEPKNFDIFNVCGEKARNLLELVSLIEQKLNKKAKKEFVEFKWEDVNSMCSNCQKAKRFLKYKSKTTFEKGIEEIKKYYELLSLQ